MLTLMNSLDATKDLNVGVKTGTASAAAALFRIFLMPVVSDMFVYVCNEIYFFFHEMFDLMFFSCDGDETNIVGYC